VAVALALVAVACGSDTDDADAPASAEPSMFTVDPLPEGFALENAGVGEYDQEWGVDESGTDEPLTVLTAVGDGEPEVVVVSATGYEGYQGGLRQASAGYFGRGGRSPQETSVDGAEALYFRDPGRADDPLDPWVGDLVMVAGRDLAIRVRAAKATENVLSRFAEAADAHGRTQHPTVTVAGYQTAGWIDADAGQAVRESSVSAQYPFVPGPPTARSLGWADGDRTLAVVALAGRSARLTALELLGGVDPEYRSAERLELAGRSAWLVRLSFGEPTVLVTTTAWGDVLVVTARGVRDADRFVREVAAGVQQVSADAWDRQVQGADGGPGLQPDRGAKEVLRGNVAGEEWLLQTDAETGGLDFCLKLTRQRRACGYGASGGRQARVHPYTPDSQNPVPIPENVIVTTRLAASKVRVRTEYEDVTADLVPIPDTETSAALLFVDFPKYENPTCRDGDQPLRIDLLDADGQVVACVSRD
jgi:hypothetical protein